MAIDPTMVKYVQTGTAPNTSGRICLGTVSYLWNSAALITSSPNGGIKDASGHQIVFKRVADVGQYYCSASGGAYPTSLLPGANASDMLSGNGRSFAVYNLTFTNLATAPPEGLFEIAVTVGTNEASTTQAANGTTQCVPPSGASSDFNYCSVVDLDIIVRTGGQV